MRFRKMLSATAVSVLVVGSMMVSVAAPANAIGIGDGYDLYEYMLSLPGRQLAAAQGGLPSAWSAQEARMAAQSMGYFRASQVYGLTAAETIAGVVPIDPVERASLGARVGSKLKVPAFNGLGFKKGIGPLSVAMIGFDMRGAMEDGVSSWFGIDATGAVCGQGADGSGGFVNWLTDKDCDAWKAAQDFVPNYGIVPRPPGWVNNEFHWATAPSPYWHGIADSWVTSGATASFVLTPDFSAGGGYDANTLLSSFKVRCKNSTTGAFSTGSGSLTAGGKVNVPINEPLACGVGSVPYAFGQFVTTVPTDPYIADAGGYFRTSPAWPLYFEPASPNYSPGIEADPQRVTQCLDTYSDGTTGVGMTPPWKETEGMPTPNCLAVPAGKQLSHRTITETGGGETNVLGDQDIAPEYTQFQDDFGTQCKVDVCALDLLQLANGVSCFRAGDACLDWLAHPEQYQCTYGGNNVGIDQCYAYANTFDEQKRAKGDAYANPANGEDTGAVTSMTPGQKIMGTPAIDPQDMPGCLDNGWQDANPVQWVLVPVQCALQWAWVPSPALVHDAVTSVEGSWADTPFGQMGPVVQHFAAIPIFTGCEGVPVDIVPDYPPGSTWGIHWKLGYSCDGPLAPIAGVVQVVTSGLVYAGGGLTLTSYVASALGYEGFGRRRS